MHAMVKNIKDDLNDLEENLKSQSSLPGLSLQCANCNIDNMYCSWQCQREYWENVHKQHCKYIQCREKLVNITLSLNHSILLQSKEVCDT